jgi:AraC-like DNA-binding protein
VRPLNDRNGIIVLCQIYGTGYVEQDGIKAHCGPGSICVYNARPRKLAWSTAYRHVTLHMSTERFRDTFPIAPRPGPISVHANPGSAGIFVDLVQSLMRNCDALDRTAASGVEDSTLRMLGTALGTDRPAQAAVESQLKLGHQTRVRNYARKRLHDPKLDVPSIGNAVGLSPRYIHQLFADEPAPLMKWVWLERLKRARDELSAAAFRDLTVSGIAFRWGFTSSAHFSRTFHARYGMTPSDFRHSALMEIEADGVR